MQPAEERVVHGPCLPPVAAKSYHGGLSRAVKPTSVPEEQGDT